MVHLFYWTEPPRLANCFISVAATPDSSRIGVKEILRKAICGRGSGHVLPFPFLPLPHTPMRRVLSVLVRLPRLFFIGLVRAYQLLLSTHLGRTCRFQPTCSTYAIQAFREYGALKGLVLSVHRLLRCHPWGGHGYDPPRWFGEERPSADDRLRTAEEVEPAP